MSKMESSPSLSGVSINQLVEEMGRIRDGDFEFNVPVPETEDLERELATLVNILLGQVRRAEEWTLQAQKRLAAAVAHEPNTPLGVVKSTSETLSKFALRLADEISDAKGAERLHTVAGELCHSICSASERMEQVIARMQRFTNLGGAIVQSVDLNELLSDVIAISAARLEGKPEVELDLKAVPPITCRPAQLTAVFASLVDNAIEAAGSGGYVGVSSIGGDNDVEVKVEDNGPGLSAEQLASIFEPTFQIVADRVSTGNWSLFSARRVIHQHDGRIKVDSAKGRGTEVMVTLPLENTLRKDL